MTSANGKYGVLEMTFERVVEEKGVRMAVPDIMYTGWYHPTWRDRMVMRP